MPCEARSFLTLPLLSNPKAFGLVFCREHASQWLFRPGKLQALLPFLTPPLLLQDEAGLAREDSFNMFTLVLLSRTLSRSSFFRSVPSVIITRRLDLFHRSRNLVLCAETTFVSGQVDNISKAIVFPTVLRMHDIYYYISPPYVSASSTFSF